MENKKLIIMNGEKASVLVGLLGLITVVISCVANQSLNSQEVIVEKERLNLRNAAFCKCLSVLYEKEGYSSVLADDGSSAGYVEIGNHGLSAYLKVFEMARDYADTIEYQSKGNKHLSLMECLDFYNSEELLLGIKSLDSLINFE
jgi:hypothetical protein